MQNIPEPAELRNILWNYPDELLKLPPVAELLQAILDVASSAAVVKQARMIAAEK
jgi:hypothetical protein